MRKYWLTLLIICALGLVFGSFARSKADSGSAARVTFTKDVAPILFNNCAACHRPGDIAPMSLLSYKDTRPWARSIKDKVVTKEMPPWPADPHYGVFSNDKRLSQRDIDTIAAWVDQGAPEGDPRDLPKAPVFYEGWHIGKPDLVLSMPAEYSLAPEGPDEYQYFKIPTNFKQDMWVQAAEARPGNRKIVHHIIAMILPPENPSFMSLIKPTPAFIEKMKQKIIFYKDGTLARIKADAPIFDDGCSTPEGGAGVFRDGTERDTGPAFLCGEAPGRDDDIWPAG
ncbi:MAG TPA: cytochrome c, partial [Blastocatellia bacterium]|nr:cytochrome c [Blastocatellia bacterium]